MSCVGCPVNNAALSTDYFESPLANSPLVYLLFHYLYICCQISSTLLANVLTQSQSSLFIGVPWFYAWHPVKEEAVVSCHWMIEGPVCRCSHRLLLIWIYSSLVWKTEGMVGKALFPGGVSNKPGEFLGACKTY